MLTTGEVVIIFLCLDLLIDCLFLSTTACNLLTFSRTGGEYNSTTLGWYHVSYILWLDIHLRRGVSRNKTQMMLQTLGWSLPSLRMMTDSRYLKLLLCSHQFLTFSNKILSLLVTGKPKLVSNCSLEHQTIGDLWETHGQYPETDGTKIWSRTRWGISHI